MRHGNDDNLPQGTCRQANRLANTMEHVLNVLIGLMGGCRGSTWEAATQSGSGIAARQKDAGAEFRNTECNKPRRDTRGNYLKRMNHLEILDRSGCWSRQKPKETGTGEEACTAGIQGTSKGHRSAPKEQAFSIKMWGQFLQLTSCL